MATFLVKVEYRTPKGTHQRYEGRHDAKDEGDAYANAIIHLVDEAKRKVYSHVRMSAQLLDEVVDGVA